MRRIDSSTKSPFGILRAQKEKLEQKEDLLLKQFMLFLSRIVVRVNAFSL
jgi:hypothetical protein